MVGSLSINFKIFRMIIQLYSKEFRKGGGHIKILKNQIQTLCANSDLLYTIVLNHTIISFENKSLWRRQGFGGSAPNKLIASVVGTGVSLRAPVPEARLTACRKVSESRQKRAMEIGEDFQAKDNIYEWGRDHLISCRGEVQAPCPREKPFLSRSGSLVPIRSKNRV